LTELQVNESNTYRLRVVANLKAMRLVKATELVAQKAADTLTYFTSPSDHRRSIRTNNPLGAHHLRNPQTHSHGRGFPKRAIGINVGRRQATTHRLDSMGPAALPGDGHALKSKQAGSGSVKIRSEPPLN
jgi:hypothetical protein